MITFILLKSNTAAILTTMRLKRSPASQSKSFLLRIWQEMPDQDWRVSLKDVTSGKQVAFPTLDDLIAYLKERETANLKPAVAAEQKVNPKNVKG